MRRTKAQIAADRIREDEAQAEREAAVYAAARNEAQAIAAREHASRIVRASTFAGPPNATWEKLFR